MCDGAISCSNNDLKFHLINNSQEIIINKKMMQPPTTTTVPSNKISWNENLCPQ